jgi:hypothetical protein
MEICLYRCSVRGTRRFFFAGEAVSYKRKALETSISLQGGSVGQLGVG